MSHLRFVLLLLAMSVPALVQAESPVQKPQLKVGDHWVYRLTDLWKNEEFESYEFRVVGVAGDQLEIDRTTLTSKSGQNIGKPSRRKVDAATGGISDTRITEGKLAALAFPLEPGKVWEYEYTYKSPKGGNASQKRKATVEGWEEVTVPAGTFRALKVVHEGTWNRMSGTGGNETGRLTDIFWYAPQAKRYIKRHYTDYGTTGKEWNKIRDELVKVELKQ